MRGEWSVVEHPHHEEEGEGLGGEESHDAMTRNTQCDVLKGIRDA